MKFNSVLPFVYFLFTSSFHLVKLVRLLGSLFTTHFVLVSSIGIRRGML